MTTDASKKFQDRPFAMPAPTHQDARGSPPSYERSSPYPNLQEVVAESQANAATSKDSNKQTYAHTDKSSDKSEDSGVVCWNDPKSVLEKNRRMLESQMACDVIFYVGEKREKLGAHKYVLMTHSDVFLDMFGDAERHEFDVPDVSPDHWWEVLRHIYCEDQKLQVINVFGILAAADKYKLAALRQACLVFLHNCLEESNACFLLTEARRHGYPDEEKIIVTYIRKSAKQVFHTPGMALLSQELIQMLLNLPNLDVDEETKRDVMDKWRTDSTIKAELSRTPSQDNVLDTNDALQDCLYVERDDEHCHRYIMDSVTSRDLFDEPYELVKPENVEMPPLPDETDRMSTLGSTSSRMSQASRRSSVHTYSRLPSCNMFPELDMVTRLMEVSGTATNDAKQADAIHFSVDRNIYLFGFGIYGPKNEGEGHFKVDTILMRKKREVVMESIAIRGAGVILPVLFERPVKVDKNTPYLLEVYITGPDSHMGASGQGTVPYNGALFTFNDAPKVKYNRSRVTNGQIPRLFFIPRNK